MKELMILKMGVNRGLEHIREDVLKDVALTLTFPVSYISESYIKTKINLNSIFVLLCGASKRFVKTFKAFIKPLKAPKTRKKSDGLNNRSYLIP